ncbi:hypothetical protein EJB05_48359, partial [Eragrostis curvula]
MGRPRGKGKKTIEAASNNDDDGSGSEEAAATPKRRGRTQKPPKDDDADVAGDTAKQAEGNGDATIQPDVEWPGKDDSVSSAEAGSKKKRRRRRLKRSTDVSVAEDEVGRVKSKPSNGFRQNGSRRKSTPRRAAEAGVECNRIKHLEISNASR